MQAFQMRTTLIDPETQKYHISKNHYRTNKKIFGKQWLKSHLVYAYENFLTLATMQKLLDWGYQIHHKDKNPQNDDPANLKLIKKETHNSLHHLGKKLSLEARAKMSQTRKGRKFSPEWRQKISQALKGKKVSLEHRLKLSQALKGKFYGENNPCYRHDIVTDEIINRINNGESIQQIAIALSAGKTTIRDRLKNLGYEFIGSQKKGKWILKKS